MKVKLLALLLILAVLCSGCVFIREITEINFVLGAAFDYNPQTDMYIVAVQTPIPVPRGEQAPDPGWMVYQAEGKSIFEAVRNLGHQSPRKMFWAHTDVYIVGQELARHGIKPVMDWLQRDEEPRVNELLILADGKASDILAIEDGREVVPMVTLERIIRESERVHAKAPMVTLRMFIQEYLSYSPYNVVPVVKSTKADVDTPGAKNVFHVSGSGVFRGDKLVGHLDPRETRGFLYARGRVESTVFTASVPPDNTRVAFEVVGLKSSIQPVVQDGTILVNITVDVTTQLAQVEGVIGADNPDTMKQLEAIVANIVEREIRETINRAQNMKTDFFGVGELLYKFHPGVWRQVEDDWENIFADLEFNVVVESTVIRTALITELKGVHR